MYQNMLKAIAQEDHANPQTGDRACVRVRWRQKLAFGGVPSGARQLFLVIVGGVSQETNGP
jgi:hypothetical protein